MRLPSWAADNPDVFHLCKLLAALPERTLRANQFACPNIPLVAMKIVERHLEMERYTKSKETSILTAEEHLRHGAEAIVALALKMKTEIAGPWPVYNSTPLFGGAVKNYLNPFHQGQAVRVTGTEHYSKRWGGPETRPFDRVGKVTDLNAICVWVRLFAKPWKFSLKDGEWCKRGGSCPKWNLIVERMELVDDTG